MAQKFTTNINKDDCIRFFNLCASLPKWRVQSEFKRQTEKAEEIHHEDQREIQKLVENNPELTMEEAANIYYDTQWMATPMLKYQRGNFLVFDDEFKNLTTYMHQLHEYYMAQAIETTDFDFEVIICSPFVYHYPEEEKFDVEWECLFQLYQRCSLHY
jgi:hypothetical protein